MDWRAIVVYVFFRQPVRSYATDPRETQKSSLNIHSLTYIKSGKTFTVHQSMVVLHRH